MTSEPTARLDAVLQDTLDRLVARRQIAHAVLAVESGDGSIHWAGAAGDADGNGRPMTTDTPVYLASVTKTYASVVALRLQERGVLGLDEPITTYLPAELTTGIHRRNGVDFSGRITVRHLLANTSGLANYFEDRPPRGRSLAGRLFTDGDVAWTAGDVARQLREELRPHFAPGTRVRYSDTNFQLLEAIIEAVTGRSFHEVLDADVLRPLDLRATWLADRRPDAFGGPERAELFVGGRPLLVPQAMASIGAQGALVATVADAIRFLRALVAGEVFERPETWALMTGVWRRFGLPLDAAAIRAPSWPIEYGLGIMRFQLPRALNGFRPMPAVIGHTGSSGSWLFHAPDPDLYLAGTVDEVTSGAVPYRVVPALLRALA